jgi:hypothetical protein
MLTSLPSTDSSNLPVNQPLLKSKNFKSGLLFMFFGFLFLGTNAQIQLINNTDRAFENATSSFAANNWSTAQPGNTRQWQVGTAAGGSTKAAYVGSGSNYNGANNSSVQHFYRDVAIPTGATSVTFRFDLRMPTTDNGDDYIRVYRTTTSNTPVSGTVPGTGYTQIFNNTATAYASFTTMSSVDLTSLAGTTVRLVFTFRSDGNSPHANPAVDNVSLTYVVPPAPTITSYNPSNGCASTTSITIDGTNLSSATAVTIGGTAVSSITSNSATQIVAVIGSGSTGTVSVTTLGGTANGAGTFTVNANPNAYNMTGGGTGCSSGAGVAVGLSGSQLGISYQLYRNGVATGAPVAGSGLAISFGNQILSGTYTVIATNSGTGCTRTQTGTSVVTINTAPSISVQPVSQAICLGSPVTFSVTAAGTSPTYQWRKNGSNIGGATSSSYTIPSIVAGDAANYDVVVSVSTCSSVTSTAATLTINPLPTVYNVTGGGTSCSSVNVGLSGSQSGVNYTISPSGTVVAGTGSAISFGGQSSSGTYTVAATNATTGCIANMSGSAVVTISSTPTITVQPTDQSACVGGSVTFNISATGGTLSYQWKKSGLNLSNGGAISGATSSSLTITGVVTGDAATDYSCEVSNSCGSEESDYVALVVNTAAVAPTTQPTSLVFSTIGVTSFIANFSASSTAGHYLVVRRTTNVAPTNPTNGTTYAVGSSALGAGTYVEYSGPDSTFSSNGLSQGTTYYYWVYAYNTGVCGTTPVYNTTSPLTGSATTLTNVACGSNPTLYWAGTGSVIANGSATSDFNTASNWSTSSGSYVASGSAPTACTNVEIRCNGSVTIALSASISVYNLNFTSENNVLSILHTAGRTLTINGDANIDLHSTAIDGSAVAIGEYSFFGAGIVDFKGNVTIGTNAALSGSGKASYFLGNSSSKLIFRADLLLGRTNVISGTYRPGQIIFDGIGLQEVLWNNNMYFSNFYDVIIGSTNNPIVRHVTGTYTPDNILNSLTINGSSVLDLATSQWIRDAAGGSFTMNGTSKMILGNYQSIPSPANGRGVVIPGSNFPGGFSTMTISPTSTIEYDGDNSMTQTIYNTPTYGNLILTNSSGSGTASRITTGTVTISGTTTVKSNVTLTPGAGITTNGTFDVNSGATVVCATNVISGSGSFNLKSGATISLGSNQGITASGGTGNITTTTRSFSTGANYIYLSTGSTNTGNGLPTTVNDLTISNSSGVTLFNAGATYTVNGTLRLTTGSFNINGNTLAVNTLVRSSGSLRGSATSSLTINGTNAPIYLTAGGRIMKNFTLNSGASATLLTDMELPGGTNYGTVTVGSGATLTTNSRLILRSTATGSARVAEIPVDGSGNALGTISGNVQMERYISARRAWRFLSVTTTGTQTINQAWQEGQAANVTSPAGYGCQMTGPNFPNGFDLYSVQPSIKTFVPSTDSWAAVTSTNVPFAANTAYMTFIRGDRTVNAFGQAATSTILRSRGSLIMGNRSPQTVNANEFAAVNNPYASAIDFRNVSKTSVDDKFYVWDPNLGTLGGYQTFIKNGSGDYEVVVGGGSYGSAGTICNEIQNGQAFMVFATGSSGTITLQENDKSTGTAPVSRATRNNSTKQIRTVLYGVNTDGSLALLDGVLNQYADNFSNAVDGDDAKKGMSFGENLSIKNTDKLLVVDRKQTVTDADTINLNLTGVKAQQYKFRFIPENMDIEGLSAYLVDNYLRTTTPLLLSDSSDAPFSIVNIPGAYAANRFSIVFRQQAAAAFTNITATRVSGSTNVQVNWQVAHEANMAKYELEKSNDGTNFSRMLFVDPSANNCSTASYGHLDDEASSGANYYRVKAIKTNGQFFYSNTVMVQPAKGGNPLVSKNASEETLIATTDAEKEIRIYPNPVINHQLNISFKNQAAGNYELKLFNNLGQSVYTGTVKISSGTQLVKIQLPMGLNPGIYQLTLVADKAKALTRQVFIQ